MDLCVTVNGISSYEIFGTLSGGCQKRTAAAFLAILINDLTIFLPVFMKKEYICQKLKFTIWNMHGKNGIFLWNNHMEKQVLFVYDEYNRYKNRLVCIFQLTMKNTDQEEVNVRFNVKEYQQDIPG